MRPPPLVRRPPNPKVHKRSGPRGQLVRVRELARAGKGEPQYRASRSAPPGSLGSGATYEHTGDTIEEAVDAVCEVGR